VWIWKKEIVRVEPKAATTWGEPALMPSMAAVSPPRIALLRDTNVPPRVLTGRGVPGDERRRGHRIATGIFTFPQG
jgi:hypothetical protein